MEESKVIYSELFEELKEKTKEMYAVSSTNIFSYADFEHGIHWLKNPFAIEGLKRFLKLAKTDSTYDMEFTVLIQPVYLRYIRETEDGEILLQKDDSLMEGDVSGNPAIELRIYEDDRLTISIVNVELGVKRVEDTQEIMEVIDFHVWDKSIMLDDIVFEDGYNPKPLSEISEEEIVEDIKSAIKFLELDGYTSENIWKTMGLMTDKYGFGVQNIIETIYAKEKLKEEQK